jgi:hypothetical protein
MESQVFYNGPQSLRQLAKQIRFSPFNCEVRKPQNGTSPPTQTSSVPQIHENENLTKLAARDRDAHPQARASPALALNTDGCTGALGKLGLPHPHDVLI